MWDLFYTITETMGTTPDKLIMIIILLGSLVFFAADFQKGLVAILILCMGLFVWFFAEGLNYGLPLLIMLMDISLMALSRYVTQGSKSIY